MDGIDISIIIINFNTATLTTQCVESIKKVTSKSLKVEFIVVDNASKNDDFKKLETSLKQYNNVQLIKSRSNSGFASGNALGVHFAQGNFLAFINSDVLFVEPCLQKMMHFMIKNEDVGCCGIQILNEEKEETTSFRPFEGLRYKLLGKKMLFKTRKNHPRIGQKLTKPTVVDFILGSFMLCRNSAYTEIGGFDTNTFLYYEETDLCFRLKKKGYKTMFLPNLKYIHLEGKSTNYNAKMKLEHLYSYLYVTRKNFGFLKYFIIKNYLILTYFFKAIFKTKHRIIFRKLLTAGEYLSQSLRHEQPLKEY